ncbi:MAG: hypothetical protein IIA64_09160 [Planctomycetes bacterium]|nr:hypothetical protein [Planctomycetota bacterium]
MGHDTVEGLPATAARSRKGVGARRVPADYRPSTRSRPGRSGAHHPGFALAAVVTLGTLNGLVQAGGPPPVVVDSIEPAEIVQGQVPQPELKIFGSNFIEGLPNETNRPTVTLRQPGKGGAEFSALAWVNFAGTVATVPRDLVNLLQAPLGVYDVIVTRPTDNASGTLQGAFTVTDGEPGPGEIALVVRSAWGGPVNDVEVVGNLAYAAIGRRLVILNVADPYDPFEIGSLNIMAGVEGVAVRDGYAFLGAHKPYRFCVVDVSDPTDPTLVWAGQGDGFSHDVQLYGDLAYVRSTGGDVDVFDITDPQNVVSLGGIGSSADSNASAMTIVGDLLYVGSDAFQVKDQGYFFFEIRIYDLSIDPLNPPLLGSEMVQLNETGNPSGTSNAIAVEGNYAAWITRHTVSADPSDIHHNTLHIVDVSNPQDPVVVGNYNNTIQYAPFLDVDLSAGFAYVASTTTRRHSITQQWVDSEGLMIFDVATDPTNPTLVSTFKTHGNVTGVEIVGNRAYVHDDGEGMIILDVTDPTKPVRLGNYHSPATLRQMEKVGDLLYIADAWNGFTVLDVTDAAHPEVVGVYLADHYSNLGVDARGIDVRDNLVYLGAGHLGLEVVDVSDPAYPALAGAFRIPSGVPACATFAAVTVWGDDPRYASIGFEEHSCDGVTGVFLNVDVTNPQDMFEAGRLYHGTPRASKIALNSQGIAFLGRSHPIYSGPELTIDASGPSILRWGGIESVADTALAGDTLFLASDELVLEGVSGLYIQDVTDPANPVVLAHIDEDSPLGNGASLNDAFAVAAQDQRLYVVGRGSADGGAPFGKTAYVFDATDPAAPLLLDAVPFVGGTRSSVYVDEPGVYVTNGSVGGPRAGLVLLELVGLNPRLGDLDGDGSVGVKDLLILLGDWGPCDDCTDCPADLDGDCAVGVKDLLILLGNWG